MSETSDNKRSRFVAEADEIRPLKLISLKNAGTSEEKAKQKQASEAIEKIRRRADEDYLAEPYPDDVPG